MSFQITIIEKREVTKTVRGKWSVIDSKEVLRESTMFDPRRADTEPRTRIEDVHGYAPDREESVVEERKVLEQTVDAIDLPAVIKAINGL